MPTTDIALETTGLAAGDSFLDSVGESDTFLKEAARIGASPLPPPARRAGHLVAGRYRLDEPLGRGGCGEVWRAHDRLSGGAVAVKLLRRGAAEAAARACREVAALRILRLPGVVRLIDEGIEDEHPFVAMEYIEGVPFPGLPAPCAWADLRGPLVRLLDTLARVHAAGFVHRDLKPQNVLVDRGGHPIIIDFGIARAASGFARITGAGTIIGTPAYLAPEQLGDRLPTGQTDLYAVGVMAFAALTGRLPHEASSFAALVDARLGSPPPPVRSLAPGVPAHVAAVVDRLLAVAPEDRPRSAAEAAELLRDAATEAAAGASAAAPEQPACALFGGHLQDGAPLGVEAMAAWFAGPDRVLHLREDAARILLERTDGIPSRVNRELDAWVGTGLARWDGARIVIDRAAIEQLRGDGAAFLAGEGWTAEQIARAHAEAVARLPRGAPGRLGHLLATEGADVSEIAAEALASAARLLGRGALARAAAHLSEGLFALRRDDRAQQHSFDAMLAAMVEAAFADGGPHTLDRALYELCRPGPTSPIATHLTQLVRAALAVDVWTERAAALAEAVPPFEDVRLERLRQGVRVAAARRVSLAREEEVLAEVGQWARRSGDALALASHADWVGRLRYCENRFEEAARLHDEAASRSDWPPLQIAAYTHGAAAWMEAFDLDLAAARAREARSLAEASRHAFFELHAEWLLRAIAYRTGRTDGAAPDLELVEVAPLFGSAYWEGAVAVTEAAVAYRNGALGVASELASRGLRAFAEAGHPIGTVLAKSLFFRAGGALAAEEVGALAARARACPVPEVGLQCLALLAEAGAAVDVEEAEARAMAAAIRPEHRAQRLDVLSVEEALDVLGRRGGAAGEGR